MDNKIDLNWTLYVSYFVSKYDIFKALANLCTSYCEDKDIPEGSDDYAQFVINWLKDNLEDYIDELLSILRYITSTDYNTEGGIDNDNIIELLDNEEFMTEFRQYLNDQNISNS